MSALETLAYWVLEPGVGTLRPATVRAKPPEGHSLVRADWSGVSPGTERLVGLGRVPGECGEAMACKYMQGGFELPVEYGYALVGTGLEGSLADRRVFVMHPHQGLAEVRDEDATPLPDAIPSPRAALIPNLETALNAVWDAELEPGEHCAVFGAGSVGLLVAYVLWRTTGVAPAIVELDPERRALAASLPWGSAVRAPEDPGGEPVAVAFHTTGSEAGLSAALEAVGFEGRVLELSWYGDRSVTLELGTHFHYGRKRIVASQVGSIAPSRRATHDHAARVREVLELLDRPELDRLLGAPVPFAEMPEFMNALYLGGPVPPLPLIRYGEPDPDV